MIPFGVSYYPELINPEEWGRDLDNMNAAGLTVVRILEFAWSQLEPREGTYEFAWLDRFLDLVHTRGMQVILGTPTPTPPAWLTEQYPEMMIERRDGTRHTYGERRAVCVNNTVYRHFCEQIAATLATRYGSHPAVLGWQIDNELIGPEVRDRFECHCPDCQWRFRDYLKQRYESLDTLNQSWGLGFWSLNFSDWGEVQTPRCHRHNKGHILDAFRFYNWSQVEFIRLQYRVLRERINEAQFISHNSTGIFDRTLNHLEYARELDVCGWDAYRGAAAADHTWKEPYTGLAHDLFRSALHKPFWIFETNTGWNQTPAYLAGMRAHGAAAVTFWHWRRHRASMEQTCRALTTYAGVPHADRIERLKATHDRLNKTGDLPESNIPRRKATILYSVDCVRDQHRDKKRPMPYLDALIHLYEPFWRSGVGMDVLQPGESLEEYRLLAMPSLRLCNREDAEIVAEWVRSGGVLLACAKTVHQDQHGVFYPTMAEPFADLLDFEILEDEPGISHNATPTVTLLDGSTHACQPWYERINNREANVLGTLADGFNVERPAVLKQAAGKGTIIYLAAFNADLCMTFAKDAANAAGLKWIENPNPNVGVIPHLTDNRFWYINHAKEPATVNGIEIPGEDFVLQ